MADYYSYLFPLGMNIARYFLFAGIPFLIFYVLFPDVFSHNKIQARFAKRKDFLREILYSLQTTCVILAVIFLVLKSPLRAYTQFYTHVSDYPVWWIPISVVLALIVHDTYFYWMHRGVHHPVLFKRVHLVHHKSVNPSPWASYSFHFLEAMLEAMVAPLVLFLMPLHPIALVAFGFSSFTINVYGHLGYEIAPRWFRHSFLFEILNTSTHHNIHHARFKGNYGLYFRIWDRIMGTEHPDYVKEYDRMQERRFGKFSTSPKSRKSILSICLLLALCFLSATPSPKHIEGKWKFCSNGAVVQIYEKGGLYFGKVIEAGEAEDNQKLQEHGYVMVLKNFEKKSPTEYCCGTVFAPKRGKTLKATLILESPNSLRIQAKYGLLSGSEMLQRL